jgi:hypothetical protein
VAKGYAGSAAIERWYGSTLTAAQAGTAAVWADAAEACIDAATNYVFAGGSVAAERHDRDNGPYVWLKRTPVTSVQTVKGWTHGGTAGTALTLTSDYEVEDLTTGRLYLSYWTYYDWYAVDYLPGTAIPAAISEATAALLADWLTNGAPGAPAGPVREEQVGDVRVAYVAPTAEGFSVGDLPFRVQQLLKPYLSKVVFA